MIELITNKEKYNSIQEIKIQGGFNIRKKIKFNSKIYNIKVSHYHNGRLRLKYINKSESHDITININTAYLDDGKVFLDPYVVNNGLINILKKAKIIKEITGFAPFNNIEVPVAIVNMGILKEYDKFGVNNYKESRGINDK